LVFALWALSLQDAAVYGVSYVLIMIS
jgi:hypothetical protein